MTQPASFSPSMPGTQEESTSPSDADLFSSHFTYSFLKGIDISGPNRPRTVTIPRRALDDMGNMERQFWEIKSANFNVVIFFKKGKFYELYDADAVTASREFGLKMVCDTTNRGKMRMAGVPEQSFAEWARLFVFRGYKIGRVEQMSREDEEAGGAKAKIVPRELVQILTPGTLTDPAMITGHQAHFVIGFAPVWITTNAQTAPTLSMDAFAIDLSRNLMYRCGCPSLFVAQNEDGAAGNIEDATKHTIASVLSTVACLMHHMHPKEVILPTAEAMQSFVRNSDQHGDAKVLASLLEEVRGWMSSGSHGSHDVNEVDSANVASWRKAGGPAHASTTTPAQDVVSAYFHFLKLSSVFESIGFDEANNIPHFTAHISRSQQGSQSLSRCESPEAAGIAVATSDAAASTPTQQESILSFERYHDHGLILDTAAIDNLELVINLKDQTEKHSLYQFLNRCVTNGGKRLMRAWLLRPSSSPVIIRERQHAIAAMLQSGLGEGWGALEEAVSASQGQNDTRKRAREETSFKTLFSSLFGVDFERNMSRLAELKRENVRVAFVDPLVQYNKHLTLILSTITGFQEMIMWAKEARSHLHTATGGQVPKLLDELLRTMIAPEPSLTSLLALFDKKKAEKSGTVIPTRGALPEYDQACDTLAELEAHFNSELERMCRENFAGDSSISFCDIGKDLFLVEVPLSTSKKSKMPNGAFTERARTTKTVKYSVAALEDDIEQYKKVTTAKANALVTVLRTIATRICDHVVVFYEASTSLSYLDCLIVLTGPNMAGKSTMMRTVAINFLVAQLGGFAFGKSFHFSPIERIFTRIGARDATHRGQSTLMVELSETSDLLQFSNSRSLCLVDELGRGTSTHDGYSIAHATLMHLSKPQAAAPLVIFSTHYHALALEVQQANKSGENTCTQLGYMDFALVDAEPSTTVGVSEEGTPPLLKKRNIVFLKANHSP
ncbi:mismatch repair protein MSH8, putative [Bodo saltans]|uniref:Mismatch repair protein MSH8, putative n=1 Tax=Bodo saltans TaxID=75058 RepID=A0A0S4IMQ7_BODSA|nr:mismatch repair protein MSH8, putative [Bodo saltans]|eukprot:CUE73371.1 mismatch repair protein MSH8, putative [Bodo saltans]